MLSSFYYFSPQKDISFDDKLFPIQSLRIKFKIGFLTRNNITPIPIQIKPRIPKNATSVSLLKDGVIKAFTACDVESYKNQRATICDWKASGARRVETDRPTGEINNSPDI